MTPALLGTKVGMTRVYDEKGAVVPITVVQCEPNHVTQVKTVDTDGYNAVQLGFSEATSEQVSFHPPEPVLHGGQRLAQAGEKLFGLGGVAVGRGEVVTDYRGLLQDQPTQEGVSGQAVHCSRRPRRALEKLSAPCFRRSRQWEQVRSIRSFTWSPKLRGVN